MYFSNIRLAVVSAALIVATASGCSKRDAAPQPEAEEKMVQSDRMPMAGKPPVAPKLALQPDLKKPAKAKEKVERKIIYTATIEIHVKNLDKTRDYVEKDIAKFKGYVQEADVSGRTGTKRRATWTIRVPVGEFNGLRNALLKLGEPQQNSIKSEEVTDQYYDLQKRIANEKKYEERLLDLLKNKTNNLKDILPIEDKLATVREKIEVMEGQLYRLHHRTAFSTVTLTVEERDAYLPEQAPSFLTRVGRTFTDSYHALVQFGQGLLLIVVALAPWLPMIIVFVVLGWWIMKRARKHAATKLVDPTPVESAEQGES